MRTISEHLKLQKNTVHKISIKHLGMKKVSSKLVPKVLTDEQKDRRINILRNTWIVFLIIQISKKMLLPEMGHGLLSMTPRQNFEQHN